MDDVAHLLGALRVPKATVAQVEAGVVKGKTIVKHQTVSLSTGLLPMLTCFLLEVARLALLVPKSAVSYTVVKESTSAQSLGKLLLPTMTALTRTPTIYWTCSPRITSRLPSVSTWCLITYKLILTSGFHIVVTGINLYKGRIDDDSKPWPAMIRRMIAEGHQLASHTWSHQDLSAITKEQRYEQIVRLEMALTNIVGKFPTYMRPPYSSCSAASGCEQDMADLGMHISFFDLDSDGDEPFPHIKCTNTDRDRL